MPFNYDSFVRIDMGRGAGGFTINHHWALCNPTKNTFESVWTEENITKSQEF